MMDRQLNLISKHKPLMLLITNYFMCKEIIKIN